MLKELFYSSRVSRNDIGKIGVFTNLFLCLKSRVSKSIVLLTFILGLLTSQELTCQTTVFSENMGIPTGTTTIVSYITGTSPATFQNISTLTYSNGGQTNSADIRVTSQSSVYTGSSGGGNVFFTSTSGAYGYSIESINASSFTGLSLQFGYRKESATSHATLSVDYWDGTAWQILANTSSTLFNETSTATSGWYLSKALTLPAAAQISGLKIRFVKTGTLSIRIDDVKLTGNTILPPTLVWTPTSNNTFTATNPSSGTQQNASISGTNLTGNVTITAPSPFEVFNGSTWVSSYTITASGTLTSTNVPIRIISGTSVGPVGPVNITASSSGATTVNYAASGLVTSPVPEINITGNSVNIVDGDNTPSLSDHTNFGSTSWGSTFTRTFTIQNTGTATLNISGASPYVLISGTNATNFSITTPPSNSIAPGSSTTFVVTFTPNAVSTFNAILTIPNNDTDESNYTFSIQGVGTASNLSDISFNSGSAVSNNSNIPYVSYQGTTLSNTAVGINGSSGAMGFLLRDGGLTLTDADNLGTELTGITFSVTNPGSIRSARLFNGSTPLGTAVAVNGTSPIVFTGLTGVSVGDNSQLALSLRVTFNSTVTDNQQFQFTVTSVTSSASGSAFASSNGGGAVSSTTGDINRIEVTADRLSFLVQPVTTTVSTNMSSVTVRGNDQFSNLDLDYTGSINITSTGSLTGSPVNAVAVSGVATYSTLNHSSLGTGLTLTATTTGLSFSNTVTSTTFDIVSTPLNSYRTTGSGLWNSNSVSPAIWERLTSGWNTSNSPVFSTSNNVYIRNGHTLTTNGSFGTTVNFIIESGGTLIVNHSSTAASILVRSGGILQINASLTITSGGILTIEDNASVYLNFAFSNPTTSIWQGTENFGALSNLYIWDWNDAQPLINGNVTTNTYNGYTAAFGNVHIDIAGAAGIGAAWNLLGSSTGTTNLTHGNFEFDSPNGFDIRFLGTVGSTANVGIQGNLVLNSGWSSARSVVLATSTSNLTLNLKGNLDHNSPGSFVVRASNTGGSSTLNIDGNILMNGAGTTSTTKFILNQNSYGTITGGLAIVNLKGNITVGANPLIGNSGNIIEQQFNFTGTTTQSVNIASVVGGTLPFLPGTRGVPMVIKANAIVQLNTNNLTINNSSTFLVEANGTLDFGFNGTTPLLVNQPGTPTGTNTFASAQGSILKITSPDGIVEAVTANLGNVQLPVSNKTFNKTATFWYIGKSNQVTGNALTSGSTGKVVICDLDLDTYTLTPSNNIGISSGTLVDPAGGKLDIRRGIVVGTNSADFTGSGRLVMTGGTYRIQSNSATVPFLSNYPNYSLTGGTVELNATGSQTLSGSPSYFNISVTGTNTLGTNFKGVSSAVVVNNNVSISGPSIFDLQSNGMTGPAGLTMTGGRLRMSKLNVTLPEITGIATPYTITGGLVELYGTSSNQTHSLRGTYGTTSINITYNNVEINSLGSNISTGAANVVAQAGFNLSGSMTINSPACFQLASGFIITDAGESSFALSPGSTLKYGGTLSASGPTGNIRTDVRTFSPTASYGFVGSVSPQTAGDGLPSTCKKIYLDKTNSTDRVLLSSNTTISDTLFMTKGLLDLNNFNLTLGTTSSNGFVSGSSSNSYVIVWDGSDNGNIIHRVNSASSSVYNFPMGDLTNYTPFELTLNSGILSNAFLTGGLRVQDHPQLGTATNYLRRYWVIDQSGITENTGTLILYSVSYKYVDADRSFPGMESAIYPAKYNTSGWQSCAGSGSFAMVGNGSINTVTKTLNWSEITTFCDFTGIGNGSPLPIELVMFTAEPKDNQVILKWTTASEINNDYFNIERTKDLEEIETISKVAGAGNSNTLINYEISDLKPNSGVSYYRLRQTDFNGQTEFSDWIPVHFEPKVSTTSIDLFITNRDAGFIQLSISGIDKDYSIEISDATGRLVLFDNVKYNFDTNLIQIDLPELKSGVFFIRISGFSGQVTRKFGW